MSIKALAPLWDWLLGSVAGLDLNARVGSSVRFFCYDTSKIVLLLAGIVFAVAVLRSYMSVERTRALLGGKREGRQRPRGHTRRCHPVLLMLT